MGEKIAKRGPPPPPALPHRERGAGKRVFLIRRIGRIIRPIRRI
jgi:hypothetical protein